MISYELAKQLKEAGFPKTESVYVVGMGMVLSAEPLFDEDGWFKYDGKGNHPIEICKFDGPYPDEHYRFAPAPTLEELIDEVKFHILQIQFSGDNNFSESNNNIWTVFQKDINSDAFMSKDLDVAIALLYLDIKKQKITNKKELKYED